MSSKKISFEIRGDDVVINPSLGSHSMLSPAPVPKENPWNKKPKPLGSTNTYQVKKFTPQNSSAEDDSQKNIARENPVNFTSSYKTNTGYKPKKKRFSKFRNENANFNIDISDGNDSFIVYEQEAIKKANLHLPEIISYSTVNRDKKVVEPLSSQFNKLNVFEADNTGKFSEKSSNLVSSSLLNNFIPNELTGSSNKANSATTPLTKESSSMELSAPVSITTTEKTSPIHNDYKSLNENPELSTNRYSVRNTNSFRRSNSRSLRQKKKFNHNSHNSNSGYQNYQNNIESYPPPHTPFYTPVTPNFSAAPMIPHMLPPENFHNHQTLPSNNYLMNNMYSPNYMMIPNQFVKSHPPPLSTIPYMFNSEPYANSPERRSSALSSPDTSMDAYETSTNVSPTRSQYSDNSGSSRNTARPMGQMSPIMMRMPVYQFNGPISPQPFHPMTPQAFIPTLPINPMIASPIFQQCIMSPQAPPTSNFMTNGNGFYSNFSSNEFHEFADESYESVERDPEFMRVANSVKRQLEYYFSLENLMNDQYLRKLMNVNTGGISLEKILRFKKLQSIIFNEAQKESYSKDELNHGIDVLQTAVEMTDDLILINDNKELRIKDNWKNFIWKAKYS